MEREYIELTAITEGASFGKPRGCSRMLIAVDLIDGVNETPTGCEVDLATGQEPLLIQESYEEMRAWLPLREKKS